MIASILLCDKNGKYTLPLPYGVCLLSGNASLYIYSADRNDLPCRRTLSKQEQLAYINAVKCLKSQPAQLSKSYEGVRSRFDDYQVTHMNNTDYIHWVVSYFTIFRRRLRTKTKSSNPGLLSAVSKVIHRYAQAF